MTRQPVVAHDAALDEHLQFAGGIAVIAQLPSLSGFDIDN